MTNHLKNRIEIGVRLLETILALFIVAGIFSGVIDLIHYLESLYHSSIFDSYQLFQSFLGHLLLMVIALELVLMLIKHTAQSILEVLTLTIARKILISATTFLELLLGVLSLLVIFIIRRYFYSRNLEYEAEKGVAIGAATRVSAMNKAFNTFIPEEIAETVGGAIARLAEEEGKDLIPGTTVKIADVGLTVVKMEDGVIEKVKVTRLKG